MNDPEYIEWRNNLVACKQAIMRSSNHINAKYLDERMDEFLAAPAMAELLRRGMVVTKGMDSDSVDIAVPEELPDSSKELINRHGAKLASVYFGSAPVKHKDQMVDIGIMTMICCQLLIKQICTELTTEDDRVLMAAASAELIQDTLLAMLKALEETQHHHHVMSIS